MSTRKQRILWLAAGLLLFAAATLHATAVQRFVLATGSSEVPVGDGTLVFQNSDELAVSVSLEGRTVHISLDKARVGEAQVRVRLSWKGAPNNALFDGDVTGLVEFDTPLVPNTGSGTIHDETGHGEM